MNYFFHPNVCHVCKSTGNLIECRCRMISYCSEAHMITHSIEHKYSCIANLNDYKILRNNRTLTLNEWVSFKQEKLQIMRHTLERTLTLHETSMFLYAKSCLVCHTQENLTSCESCYSVYVCPDHTLREHKCSELLLSVELEHYYIYSFAQSNKVPMEYLNFDKDAIHDMNMFVELCLQYNGPKCLRKLYQYCHSDIFSTPLTLIHVMLQAQLSFDVGEDNEFVIHVISEKPVPSYYNTAWEIILHELIPDTILRIIIIVLNSWDSYRYKYNMCKTCRDENKLLRYEEFYIPYHQFMNHVLFPKPDVIIVLDTEFGNEEAWTEIITDFQRQSCPLILTTSSEVEAKNNIILIQKVLGSHAKLIINEKNKFASFKPCRDYKSDSVSYRNQYLTVYRDLENPSESI